MQLTPEVKAQLAEQKKDCVFCKIIKKEIQSKIVYEDEKTLGVLDIYPAVKGHTIYLLKEHYPIMPYLPVEDFTHLFGLLPQLTKAVKGAMVAIALNIFIANGGAAGQQYPHFLIHLMPRDEGDGFFQFLFNRKEKKLAEDKVKQLQMTLAQIMQNYFLSSPQEWHSGAGGRPSYLQGIESRGLVLYEDEKVLCLLPSLNIAAGQMELYSKLEERDIEKLAIWDAVYLFTVGSFCASLLFQVAGAQGTNLLVKSGITDDNREGRLCVHILPRAQNDSLQWLHWQPEQQKYNLDGVQEKIKEKMWNVKFKAEMAVEKKVVTEVKPMMKEVVEKEPDFLSAKDEILRAIQRMQGR